MTQMHVSIAFFFRGGENEENQSPAVKILLLRSRVVVILAEDVVQSGLIPGRTW